MKRLITATVMCNRKKHQLSITPRGIVIVHDHARAVVEGERIAIATGGTSIYPCIQIQYNLVHDKLNSVEIPDELIQVKQQVKILGTPLSKLRPRFKPTITARKTQYLDCDRAKLHGKSYRKNLISKAATMVKNEMKLRGWDLHEKTQVHYNYDSAPIRKLYWRRDGCGAQLWIGARKEAGFSLDAGLDFFFQPSVKVGSILLRSVMSDWVNGVRTYDMLLVADLLEWGFANRRFRKT